MQNTACKALPPIYLTIRNPQLGSVKANKSSAIMSSFRSHKSEVWRLELLGVQIIEIRYKYGSLKSRLV